MKTKTVVSKRTARGAAVKTSQWLWSSLLVLVIGLAACGQTVPQTQRAHPKIGDPQQSCVRVGRDSCYATVLSGGQSPSHPQTCVRVGRDSCYATVPASQPASSQQTCVRVGRDSCYGLIARR